MFLVADIFSDDIFIQSDRAHAVSSRPKTVPRQVLRSAKTSSMDQDRRLSFQFADGMGHAVFGGHTKTHVDMIRPGVPFDHVDLKPLTKFLQYIADFFPDSSIQDLLPVFWDKHDMVSTVPSYVRLGFPFSHKLFLGDRQAASGRAFISCLATPERSNLFGSRRHRRWFNCCNCFLKYPW